MRIKTAAFSALLPAALLFTACSLSANGESKQANNAAGNCVPGAAQGRSEAGLDQISLCIQSGDKKHGFTVEMARTPQQQSKGLMFRESLADDRGMLFPYQQPSILSFWMKNTLIPLDIIFIRADGSIESIAANTTPYSLESVSSGEKVSAVLEIRGGLAAQRAIKPGDIIKWQE